MTRPADPTDEIASLYGFSSSVIADPPDEDTIERLTEEQFPRDVSPQALANGYQLLRSWQRSIDDPAEGAAELRRIHTRMFVGPRPKLQVHESWYADDYLGFPLAMIKRSYRDLGIQPAADLREEADHAAVELAALEMLASESDDDHRRAFLAAHGWWLPDLADDIRARSEEPFYEAVGWLLEGALEADTYLLSLDVEDLSPGYSRSPSAYTNR